MRTRQREQRLGVIAAALLLVQLGLLGWLWQLPSPPEELPSIASPALVATAPGRPPPDDADLRAVLALDTLLRKRVENASLRLGQPLLLPSPALLEAARANPSPGDPAVQALLEAYAERLAALGETLDGASAPLPPDSTPDSPPDPLPGAH